MSLPRGEHRLTVDNRSNWAVRGAKNAELYSLCSSLNIRIKSRRLDVWNTCPARGMHNDATSSDVDGIQYWGEACGGVIWLRIAR